MLGPLEIDQTPAPAVGELAERLALLPMHTDWLLPATEGVGLDFTVTVMLDADDMQGELLIVQVKI